ncbi:MAG: hypothetical protein AB3N20_22525 [Rhizobiaceae bacterium]
MTIRKKLATSAVSGTLALGLSFALNAIAQAQTFTSDVIIQGSACVGFDCNTGESFGFDTLRLKENNLRIHFNDTSTSASFPSNDWRIVANDSSNGGGNYLAIEDSTAGRQVFRVDAGAPANSLRVDNVGDVGIGTSNPVLELHVVDGDSPTLRLEQNGSSGFTPQTFDLVSNEANFFIRDVTNGSQLPFRIKPGADSDSLFIAANNNVGIGTDSPSGKLHTRGPGVQLVYFESSDNNAVQVRMVSDSANRRFLARNGDDSATMSQIIFGDNEIKLAGATDSGANLYATINASGILTQGPTCSGAPCDGVFDPAVYTVESIEDHAEYMWKNKHLWAVGPTSPDKPFNLTEKTAGILHELEKAHIYIEQLHHRIAKLEAQSGTR